MNVVVKNIGSMTVPDGWDFKMTGQYGYVFTPGPNNPWNVEVR